jgi:hypothetical protein
VTEEIAAGRIVLALVALTQFVSLILGRENPLINLDLVRSRGGTAAQGR